MNRLRAKLLRGRGGNVALVTALLAPVVVLLAGGAVDVTNASMRQAQLQAAADAAAIASVARNSPAYNDAVNMPYSSGTVTLSDPAIAQQAQAVFNADLQNTHDATPTFNLVVTKTGTTVSSVVTTSTSYAPAFLGLIGRNSVPLAASSNASDNIPAYMNFYMLLDNTPSMGLGATQQDINDIELATGGSGSPNGTVTGGCAFSCHATSDPSEDNYTIAQNWALLHPGYTVTMRIDVVRQATQQLTQTAYNTEQTNGISNEFQMAVYDFGAAALTPPALNQVSALSPNLTTTVYNNANSIDLETVPANNDAYTQAGPPPTGSVGNNDEDTSFDYTMTQLGAAMLPKGTTAGNGSTAQSPVPILFLVTDGMVDQNNGGRQMGGINLATCTALKNKGILIAILYTTYTQASIQNDSWSMSNVAPLLPQVAPALQTCSSGAQYFQAVSPTDGIPEAMAKLFQSVVAQVRITQ